MRTHKFLKFSCVNERFKKDRPFERLLTSLVGIESFASPLIALVIHLSRDLPPWDLVGIGPIVAVAKNNRATESGEISDGVACPI